MKKIIAIAALALILVGCGKQPSSNKGAYYTYEVKGDVKYKYVVDKSKKTLLSKATYKNGKKNGVEVHYCGYKGKKRYVCKKVNWINDKREGKITEWYSNGRKSSQYNYVDDKRDGEAYQWHENGKLYKKMKFYKGKEYGISRRYYEDGTLEYTVPMIDGVPNGKAKYYNENGSLYSISYWVDGVEKSSKLSASEKAKMVKKEKEAQAWRREDERKRKATTTMLLHGPKGEVKMVQY